MNILSTTAVAGKLCRADAIKTNAQTTQQIITDHCLRVVMHRTNGIYKKFDQDE